MQHEDRAWLKEANMRFSNIFRALASAAVLFSLWSCTRALESKGPESSEPFKTVKTVSEDHDLKTKAVRRTTDLKEVISVLEACEESWQQIRELETDKLIELSRLCFIRGELEEKAEKERSYEKGRYYAELLCQREPSGAEGHYWLALNLCGIAEISRPAVALKMVPEIVEELKLALSLNETYDQAGPHRVIGRIYSEAPCWPLSEGDINKALHHLRRAVGIAPENSTNHLYLAEILIQLDMADEAHRELEAVLASTQHTLTPDGLDDDQRQALSLITRIKGNTQAAVRTCLDPRH
jgi:tetratricopeptide (TPR) repeat protein